MKPAAIYEYIEKNQENGICYLNDYLFTSLMAVAQNIIQRPIPPKFNAGGGSSGYFSHKKDTYIYDFNCPIYKNKLNDYQKYINNQKTIDRLYVLTSKGQVQVIMSNEKFLELI